MIHNLPVRAHEDILRLAAKYHVENVILFGSRATGRHWERSDIDLAVQGGNTVEFALAADEEIRTLLFIDVVNLNKRVQPELLSSIRREGVVLVGQLP